MDFRKLRRGIYEVGLLINETCIVANNRGDRLLKSYWKQLKLQFLSFKEELGCFYISTMILYALPIRD